jgi:hypothetical protein
MVELIVLRGGVLLEVGIEKGESIRFVADLPFGSGDGAVAVGTMRTWSWYGVVVLLKAAF